MNTALAGFGGLTTLVVALATASSSPHLGVVIVAQSCWLAYAAAQLRQVNRRQRRPRAEAVALAAAAGLSVITVWAAGGPHTPVGSMSASYLALLVVLAAAQLPVPLALGFAGLCTVSRVLPLAYGSDTPSQAVSSLIAGAMIAAATIGLVLVARVTVGQLEATSARLRARDAALRELATLIATDAPLEHVMAFATHTITRVCGTDGSCVLATHSGRGLAMGCSSLRDDLRPGRDFPITPGSGLARMLDTGEIVAGVPATGADAALGYASLSFAPIVVRGRVWGALTASLRPGGEPPEQFLSPLKACAELVGVAIANAEQAEILRYQATTDALTELLNHRVLHDRIVEDVARARRHGRPLSLAVFDIDHFKQINDSMGHSHGDHILRTIAGVLRDMSRTEDALGRIGGDEFALLMPETAEHDALRALERVRRRIAGDTGHTVSVGVCGIEHAADAGALLRRADCALYWSKANGRNLSCIFDPHVMDDPSADERAQALQRSQALAGLRALAAAIDAKDASTHQHSERVAKLAAQVAERLGWPPERVALMHEAGLVHDVGKIGVPDAVLLKPARLSPAEFEQIQTHAALGARIVESVLTAEQVAWVRSHHERPDGHGYPDGLTAPRLPEGATIIAVVDAFDAMTSQRPYGSLRTTAEAIAECESLIDAHFAPAPVAALAGLLGDQFDEQLAGVTQREPEAARPA